MFFSMSSSLCDKASMSRLIFWAVICRLGKQRLSVEPYEYHEGDDIVGIDADIAQAICDKLGYELKIEDMEFDSILPAVQSGKADFGAAGMTVTEDRKSSVDFTDTYADASQVIIVKK